MKKIFFLLLFIASLASAQTTQKKVNIVCAGNSITNGTGNTATIPYPTQLQRLLGGKYVVTNSGVPGQTTQQISTNYTTQIGTYYDASTYASNVVIIYEGRNDLSVNNVNTQNVTPTAAYNNLVTLCGTARSQGWKVIIVTITPSWTAQYLNNTTVTGYNNLDSDRLTVNASIVANWATFADALVDIGADSNMGTLGQNAQAGYVYSTGTRPTKNVWYDDGVHYLNTGYGLLAERVKQAILKLI